MIPDDKLEELIKIFEEIDDFDDGTFNAGADNRRNAIRAVAAASTAPLQKEIGELRETLRREGR